MADLARAGISMKEITDKLTSDAIKLFADPFEKLLAAISKAAGIAVPASGVAAAPASGPANLAYRLPENLAKAVSATLDDWRANNKVRRLWSRDASLWSNTDESKWLGWLGIVTEQISSSRNSEGRGEIRAAGFTHALLLGMGGSSLCVEVLKLTFGDIKGRPEMLVLDSTDPAQLKAVESKLVLAKIFIVSSKSGSTLNRIYSSNIFMSA